MAIASFKEAKDIWLIYHCPIEWIRNYILEEQYSNLKIDKNKIKLYNADDKLSKLNINKR